MLVVHREALTTPDSHVGVSLVHIHPVIGEPSMKIDLLMVLTAVDTVDNSVDISRE